MSISAKCLFISGRVSYLVFSDVEVKCFQLHSKMQCFGCGRKYGLFIKEYGCPNCGYSYCAKCLKRPMEVPKHKGKVLNVCVICYHNLSKTFTKIVDCESLRDVNTETQKPSQQVGATALILEVDPPENLGNVLTPISINSVKIDEVSSRNKEGCSSKTCEDISERLENLKSLDEFTSDDEIRSRLAKLKDESSINAFSKAPLPSTDNRSDEQKVNNLLEQYVAENRMEAYIDNSYQKQIQDIERRLQALRDVSTAPSFRDEETVSMLESSDARVHNNINFGTEELPWCSICNEDAQYRCKDCGGELFCSQCFNECHNDDDDYRLHSKTFYRKPNFKEDNF